MVLYAFFTRPADLCSLFLRAVFQTPSIAFRRWRSEMDIVFLGAVALLWGLMVLLVWGFRKLERPQGARP